MKKQHKIITALALTFACAVSGWVLPACTNRNRELLTPQDAEISDVGDLPERGEQPPVTEEETPTLPPSNPATPAVSQPEDDSAQYIKITTEGVNIRSGAGAGYSRLGTAEMGTLYAVKGKSGDWYKTEYLHKTAYISAKYCTTVHMKKSSYELEKVIGEGYKCLGVPYVYGATRYHNGSGAKLSGFDKYKFDCSSLMQYIFKLGANVNLQMNTRTQIFQGKTVSKSGLKRGDLMFFTNASRKNLTGVERVGHVALYLGDNYILHTASDYAKIEQISPTRWGYFIQAQRML